MQSGDVRWGLKAVLFGAMVTGTATSGGAQTVAERTAQWQKLDAILPPAPKFESWVKKTNAVPPDFNALPKNNTLPDPLVFLDGHKVRNAKDWAARREEISTLSQKYVWGKLPPAPKLDRAEVIEEYHSPGQGPGYTVRNVKLMFGLGGKAAVRARLYLPDGPGPMPALINSDLVGWAPELLRRGYISAGYAGNDSMDDAAALTEMYPEYDFALLPRRAWIAALVVDYLYMLPQVNKQQIAIYGYSRNGKMASIAAALDRRITAVIAGSTGVGGVLPWRAAGEVGVGEGTEATTRAFPTWFAPQLRYFTGREDRLPVDGNLVAAMIAPRSLLIQWGLNDQVTDTWGSEQTYYSALSVYSLLGAPNKIGTMRVAGFHGAQDVEAELDWLDIQFMRSPNQYTSDLMFAWDWNKWKSVSKDATKVSAYPSQGQLITLTKTAHGGVDSVEHWQMRAIDLKKRVQWMLGDAPVNIADADRAAPFRRSPVPADRPNPAQVKPDLPAWSATQGASMGWTDPEKSATTMRRMSFSSNLSADLYYPRHTPVDKKLPLVIWLHGYSYSEGYMWPYHADLHPILALVRAGYAVLAYDQSGFGARQDETQHFYERYPKWSHMGRMVEDVHTAIDKVVTDEQVDANRVYLFGYSIGAQTALYAAASDCRIKGVVSVAGFTPMRTDTLAKGTGGVARFSHQRDFTPRMGYFVRHESQIPYDYQDVLALVAPRPVLVVQPTVDREATPADVHAAVLAAKQVYGLYNAQDKLTLIEPDDINRLTNATMQKTVDWMNANFR